MYKSHCACTGNEQVSLFVQLEICNTDDSETHENEMEMSCCSIKEEPEANECQAHSTDCECENPEITYIKLKNQVVNEEVKFTKVQPIQIAIIYSTLQTNFWDNINSSDYNTAYSDPPPLVSTAHDFLIQIQQLKIPHIA